MHQPPLPPPNSMENVSYVNMNEHEQTWFEHKFQWKEDK